MERKAYWYSVIQYCPSEIRGEKLNVGILMHGDKTGELHHSILDETSPKVRCLFETEVNKNIFKVQKEHFDYFIHSLVDEGSLFMPSLYEDSFITQIKGFIPKEFFISEPTFSLTRDPNQLFETLMKTYVGEFSSKDISIVDIVKRNAKQYTKEIFTQREWLGTKIKQNVKIRPIKDINHMQFTVDYAFKNGIWNFIYTAPSNSTVERLTDWFSKTNTIIDNFERQSGLYLIYDTQDQMNEDNTIDEMVSFLKKKDNRVFPTSIESPSFDLLLNKVETEAKDLATVEQELIAM